MSTFEEISKAISDHDQWTHKLKLAIVTRQFESTPEQIKQDNNCSFGKWLHGQIDDETKQSSSYHTIVDLHAKFHMEAGSILDEALNGDKDSATSRLGFGSKFTKLSSKLMLEMKRWQDSLS